MNISIYNPKLTIRLSFFTVSIIKIKAKTQNLKILLIKMKIGIDKHKKDMIMYICSF